MMLIIACVMLVNCCSQGSASSQDRVAPLYHTVGESYYDVGTQHGSQAKQQIGAWLATDEMSALETWTKHGSGRDVFAKLKDSNAVKYPQFVEEMRGIADGAGVSMDSIWLINLSYDLSNIQAVTDKPNGNTSRHQDHCTDVYAQPSSAPILAHGHNEDWNEVVKPLWYWLSQKINGEPGCAGLAYPGTLIGYAPTWNSLGIYSTQNSLFPKEVNTTGLAAAFVQKAAICSADSIESAIDALKVPGWSTAASVNLIDFRRGSMANVELYLKRADVHAVVGNYSHENMFKQASFLGDDIGPDDSTLHRQARLDELPTPQDGSDIEMRLGDEQDGAYPIYRNITLTTLVLSADPTKATAELKIWQNANPSSSEPLHIWDLKTFFTEDFTHELESKTNNS